jgi:hypothetical protein
LGLVQAFPEPDLLFFGMHDRKFQAQVRGKRTSRVTPTTT